MSIQEYGRAGDAAAPSPLIWKDFPMSQAVKTPGRFIHIWDDFVAGRAADASPNGTWELVGTNADLDVVEDELNGVIALNGSGADNDSAYLRSAVLYDLTMNNGKRFWFEIRCKVEDEDADQAIAIGLGEAAAMTAELNADDGATIIDEDFIGFLAVTDATNMGDIKSVYNQGGSGTTVVDADSHSPVDDTYVKLGMRFDGKKTVTFYVNGASVATLDVDTLTGNSLTNYLGVVFGIKNCAAATQILDVDWVRFACEKYANGR